MEKPTERSINELSKNSSHLTSGGVLIDIGTGDGRFVYQLARQNPQKFCIGIDANPRALEHVSKKAQRKPRKGGLNNVLFIQAAIEALPHELDGVADEVHIHFPWGSLLRAVATGHEAVLRSLRQICAPGALLEIIIGFNPERDQSEMQALGVKSLTQEFLEQTLTPRYEMYGFKVLETGVLAPSEWPKLETSWAKRLQAGAGRVLVYLIAQAKCLAEPERPEG